VTTIIPRKNKIEFIFVLMSPILENILPNKKPKIIISSG
jgi:hypothetical protein